jgi:NADH-quinone oxidoreductase subunit D
MQTKRRTVTYNVTRNPDLAAGGGLVNAPIVPVEGEVFVQDDEGVAGEHMLINIGPQHPATHGVLRLVLELDGEVEKMMEIVVTERCKVVRVILMEMDRIFSHLLWLGTTAIDLGAFTVFLYTFQERERIYNLHESYTGARITTSATRIGGMMADLPAGWVEALEHFMATFPRTLEEVETLLTNNSIWIGRTQDVGVISAEDAVNFGLSGANLRASGVDYDVRKDNPYYDYETYDFDVPIGEHGDIYDRYLCRMEEMRQSLLLLRQAIDRLPGGPINVADPRIILPSKTNAMNDMESMIHHFKVVMEGVRAPVGESWFSVESSKGELGMYVVSDGGSKPVRWRVRGPSFINIAALPHMVEGSLLSDVIAVNASLDIVLGEIDR